MKESNFTVWFKLCKDVLSTLRDLYICAVYIPPQNSTYYKNNYDTLDPESVTPIDHLENEIAQFQDTGDILLLGDFNARTGNKCDFMDNNNLLNSSEVYNVLNKYSDPNIVKLGRAQRNNSDQKKNQNGRTLGDSGGDSTSFHYNGNSVVDYGIAGENLLPLCSYFMVSPTSNSISDHADIQMHLEILNNNHDSYKKHPPKLVVTPGAL